MNTEDFEKGNKILFINEGTPFKVIAKTGRFVVLTRALDLKEDLDLLEHEVERGAYLNIEIAYELLKKYKVYKCVDLTLDIMGSHNLILNPYNFNSDEDCEALSEALFTNTVQISKRNQCPVLGYEIVE